MAAFEKMKGSLIPGGIYRREDLAPLSSNLDRYLARLVEEGSLKKLKQGLYLCPASSAFGESPPTKILWLRPSCGTIALSFTVLMPSINWGLE